MSFLLRSMLVHLTGAHLLLLSLTMGSDELLPSKMANPLNQNKAAMIVANLLLIRIVNAAVALPVVEREAATVSKTAITSSPTLLIQQPIRPRRFLFLGLRQRFMPNIRLISLPCRHTIVLSEEMALGHSR